MRFFHKKYISLGGEIRFIEKFLFLPKRIDNETRWLEKAKWKEEFDDFEDEWWPKNWE